MISFIQQNRKILISVLISIGILSAVVDGVILLQRPQTYKSKAASSVQSVVPDNIAEFVSSQGVYSLSYDVRLWGSPQSLGARARFNLNHEYGFARLDIVEGESEKSLDDLTQEIIKESTPIKVDNSEFQGKPAYLLTYKEEVVGEDVYFYKQIVKNNDKFVIFEKRAPNIGNGNSFLDNLLSNLSFAPKVKGIVSSDLTTVELVDLVRPSIANIVYVYCLDIINVAPSAALAKPKYHFCGLSKGSGFIIDEHGVVATNGHVVKVYPEEGLVANLLQAGSRELSIDLIRSIYLSRGQTPTQGQIDQFYQDLNVNPQYLDRFLTAVFNLIGQKKLSVATVNEAYYVNVGNQPVEVDYHKLNQGDYAKAVVPSLTTYTAKLIDLDYPNRYSYEAVVNKNYHRGADVALLRIDNATDLFPALQLGSIENLREGTEVLLAGYPTLVEGEKDPRSAISYQTSTKPTFTRGIISALKQDITGKSILQTDASIDHGNSGGPGFDLSGQVVGIATFMAESKSGNFNFLRDVQELKDLMSKNNVENKLGQLTDFWQDGLIAFRSQYYNQAIKNFQQVEALSPNHPTVKELIGSSKEAILRGESLEGPIGFIKSPKSSNILLLVFGAVSATSFMSAGFLTMLPVFTKEGTYVS